jgi:hypothetical protein
MSVADTVSTEDTTPPDPEKSSMPVADTHPTVDEPIVVSSKSAEDAVEEAVEVSNSEGLESADDAVAKASVDERLEVHLNSAVATTGTEDTGEGNSTVLAAQNGNTGGLGLEGDPIVLEPNEDNAERMKTRSINKLSSLLNLHPTRIRAIGAYERSWPNSALGCPIRKEKAIVAQVTSGYVIDLEAQGQRFEFHTDEGDRVLLCPLVAAQEDLAQLYGLSSISQIRVISIVERKWLNANLGCANQGGADIQVTVPGYLIVLEAQGQRFEYRTDQAGNQAKRC